MTSWTPRLAHTTGALKYQALVDALQRDIDSGILAQGTRLPTQRELANRLGIAIGTVSRAYAVAERRGIISGEVGRGTFVRDPETVRQEGEDESADPELIDLSRGRLMRDSRDPTLARTLSALSRRTELNQLLDRYQPPGGMARHRAAGAAWVARAGLVVDPSRVIVTSGAQHGAAVALTAIAQRGDLVLTEQLSYSGVSALGGLLGLRLQSVAMDSEGIRPDALEAACRSGSPRALFCMPTLHNPTGLTMPAARRQEIADIAMRYDVTLLEDDVNGFVPAEPTPPLAAYAPSHTYYITGTSKSLAPGLRIGYLVPPADRVDEVSAVIQATTWFTAPLMAEVVTEWIENGEADEMVSWKRAEIAQRHAMASHILDEWLPRSSPVSFHCWLELPDPWRSETFVAQARSEGVLVNSAEEFLVGRDNAPHAVRVCLGAAISRSRLETGLRRLAALLRSPFKPAAMIY